ncbi:MAG: hypothetical protein ABI261_04885 [Ginsengibacter sp.]
MKSILLIPVIIVAISFTGCSRKIHPSKENNTSVEKTTVAPTPKATFPKVISVNDSAASTSVDGRLYYDVMGHRYWKNYKNGKYYLFNKSMYNNPAFKKR